MRYQPSRTRIAERAGMIRAQGARMDDVHVIRAGEPTPCSGERRFPSDEEARLIRYGVALLIKGGAVFSSDMMAFLIGDQVVVEGPAGYLSLKLPEHAIGGAA